jgi:hypothetical protein
MLSIENRTAWAKAEKRAREIKPRVRVIEFGVYEVASSKPGNPPYTVRFGKNEGHWVASCTCIAHIGPAGLTDEQRAFYQPKPCLHCVSAYSVHAALVYKRQQQREQEHPLPKCGCGKPGFACHNAKWWCIICIQQAMRDGLVDLAELDEARSWEDTQAQAEADAERAAYEEMERDRRDLFGN